MTLNTKSRVKIPDSNSDYIPVTDFKTVSFFDTKTERMIVLLYSLGEDGIVREFTGTEWKAFPIKK
jgi:hypothetical protein